VPDTYLASCLLTSCRYSMNTNQFLTKAHALFNKSKQISHEAPEVGYKYSSTLTLTLALDVVSGQSHAPAALSPGKRLGICCTGG
jgi:hypothetical protein